MNIELKSKPWPIAILFGVFLLITIFYFLFYIEYISEASLSSIRQSLYLTGIYAALHAIYLITFSKLRRKYIITDFITVYDIYPLFLSMMSVFITVTCLGNSYYMALRIVG